MPGETLKIVAGNAAGNTIALDQELVIGRSTPGLGSLGGDSEISRVHARIHRDPSGQLVVEDLGSTNGTFVNGNRISGTQALSPGDQVRVGQTTMTVEGAGAEGATTVGAIVPPAAAAQVPPAAAVAAQPPTQQIPPQQPPYGQPPGAPPGAPPPPYGGPPGGQKKSPAPWIALGAVVLAAIIVGVLAIAGVFGGSSDNSKKAASTTPATTPVATQPTPSVAMPQTVPETTDTSSSNPSDYPPRIEKTFVDSCSSGGAPRSVCQCTFSKLKNRYTFTEFVDLLNQSKGGSLPDPIQSIVKQCVNQ